MGQVIADSQKSLNTVLGGVEALSDFRAIPKYSNGHTYVSKWRKSMRKGKRCEEVRALTNAKLVGVRSWVLVQKLGVLKVVRSW